MTTSIKYLLFILLSNTSFLFGQSEHLTGTVSFVTSQNVYVKFISTDLISIGDTLYSKDNQPCLVVAKKSSSSTVTKAINSCSLKKDDTVYYVKKETASTFKEPIEGAIEIPFDTLPQKILQDIETETEKDKSSRDEKINSRLGVSSYSNFNEDSNRNTHRMMVRANLNIQNINGSKFSIQSYANYRQNFYERDIPNDYQTKFLRLYNAAVIYQADSTLTVTLGRNINRKVSSLGAIDGIQAEKQLGQFFTGAIAGYKPDLFRFDFSTQNLEYGIYGGYASRKGKINSQTTLGLLEMRNLNIVDRRYAYFQHVNTINQNLNIFSTVELDLYQKLVNGPASLTPRLTNLYISARYKLNRKINFSLSYDSRKRIIYYETLRTDVESLLADDEARQGIRSRVNLKPWKYVNVGLSYSKRFQFDGSNASDNFSSFVSYSKVPIIAGRFTFNFNMNQATNLSSQILSFRYNRAIWKEKISSDFYYRNVQYSYNSNENQFIQNYYGTSLNLRLSKTLTLGLMGELSTRTDETNFRLNTRIIKRFRK